MHFCTQIFQSLQFPRTFSSFPLWCIILLGNNQMETVKQWIAIKQLQTAWPYYLSYFYPFWFWSSLKMTHNKMYKVHEPSFCRYSGTVEPSLFPRAFFSGENCSRLYWQDWSSLPYFLFPCLNHIQLSLDSLLLIKLLLKLK